MFNSLFSSNDSYFLPILKNSKLSIGNFYFNNLIFRHLSDSLNGGSISLSSSSLKILIEDCFFLNCSCNLKGGAIFYDSPNGQFYINKVCGNYCYTLGSGINSQGQFSTHLTNSNYPIFFNLISISNSSPKNFLNRYDSISVHYGLNNFTNFNSSYNNAWRHSCQGSWYSTLTLKYLNMNNNTLESYACIGPSYGYFYCSYINMIYCSCQEYGLVHHNGQFSYSSYSGYMSYCIFQYNNGKTIDLCCGGSLLMSNSIFDTYTYNRDIPITQNISIGIINTYLFENIICKSLIDNTSFKIFHQNLLISPFYYIVFNCI